jgi:7-keto-8-aminopelargonate synthetase-like enzyme
MLQSPAPVRAASQSSRLVFESTVRAMDVTPIRVVPVGDEDRTMQLAARLMTDGHFVNVAVFPAVPVGRGAVRIMLNNHHTLADIRAIVDALARGLATRRRLRVRAGPASPLR